MLGGGAFRRGGLEQPHKDTVKHVSIIQPDSGQRLVLGVQNSRLLVRLLIMIGQFITLNRRQLNTYNEGAEALQASYHER